MSKNRSKELLSLVLERLNRLQVSSDRVSHGVIDYVMVSSSPDALSVLSSLVVDLGNTDYINKYSEWLLTQGDEIDLVSYLDTLVSPHIVEMMFYSTTKSRWVQSPYCFLCSKYIYDIEDYTKSDSVDPYEMVVNGDSTYHAGTNTLMCNSCYVKSGLPPMKEVDELRRSILEVSTPGGKERSAVIDSQYVLQSSPLINKKLLKLDKYLEGHSGFIAGGVFKDLFTDNPIRDVDIFFRNSNEYKSAVVYYDSESNMYKKIKTTSNSTTYYDVIGRLTVDLICTKYGTPKEILEDIDFTICKYAYYRSDHSQSHQSVLRHTSFWDHLSSKELVVPNPDNTTISTLIRSYRYTKYGYDIRGSTLRDLLSSISKMTTEEVETTYYNKYYHDEFNIEDHINSLTTIDDTSSDINNLLLN